MDNPDAKGRLTDKIAEGVKYHLVDSTAILAPTHPIFSVLETCVSGMSDDVSITSRVFVTGMTYAGVGVVLGKCRDYSRRVFKITDETKERWQYIHDSLFLAATNIPLSVGIYTFAGETDPKKIAIGMGAGVVTGAAVGPLVGYAMDVGRDLLGLKECERASYPSVVKKQKKGVKKVIAAALVAASIGLMGLVYHLTPEEPVKKAAVTQVAEKGLERLVEE